MRGAGAIGLLLAAFACAGPSSDAPRDTPDDAAQDRAPLDVAFEDVPADSPSPANEAPEIDPLFLLDDGAMKTPVVQVMTGSPGRFANPAFFAYQDGDGPWRPLVPEATGVYRFHVDHPSGRYGVAVASTGEDAGLPAHAKVVEVRLFFATTDEALSVPATGPGDWPPPGKQRFAVKGSVKGWEATDPPVAHVACSAAVDEVPKSSPGYSLAVASGLQDVAASLGDRGWIRRDLGVTKDWTLAIDLAVDGFDLARHQATLAAPDPNDKVTWRADLLTARRTLLPGTPAEGATAPFFVLPPDRRVAGDLYRLSALARLDGTRSREASAWLATPSDRALKLPPIHLTGSVEAGATGPVATWGNYPDAKLYRLAYETRAGTWEWVRWDVAATPSRLGAERRLVPPDLGQAEGWSDAFAPLAGVGPTWELRAYQCSGSVEDLLAALEWGPLSKTEGVPDGLTVGAAVLSSP
ncbi:MAG: hypothetical protein FJ087_13415 [Deltaproteobacteria bacterium]|nr:hypothetical protein [Deltaproteobacteria bacterium]